jgi:hypothetical protein
MEFENASMASPLAPMSLGEMIAIIATWHLESACMRRPRKLELLSKPTPRLGSDEIDRKREKVRTRVASAWRRRTAHCVCSSAVSQAVARIAHASWRQQSSPSNCREPRNPSKALLCGVIASRGCGWISRRVLRTYCHKRFSDQRNLRP